MTPKNAATCGNSAVELAYGTAPQHRGRGIATRVLERAGRWCFSDLHAARVELLISRGNDASRRVAEKAGFEFQAIQRTTTPGTSEQYDDLLYVLEPPRT